MRVSRTTGAVSGLAIVVLGIWGGLIPFIGPYFNFFFGPNTTWHYSVDRLWLNILPGAVAVLGGLMIIYAGHRANGGFGAWLALAAGAWFVVGPTVSILWRTTGLATVSSPIGAPFGGSHRQLLELVGYYYGVGVLIIGFAAFSLGRFVSRAAMVSEEAEPRSLAEARAADGYEPEPAYAGQPSAYRQPVANRNEYGDYEREQHETERFEPQQQPETQRLEDDRAQTQRFDGDQQQPETQRFEGDEPQTQRFEGDQAQTQRFDGDQTQTEQGEPEQPGGEQPTEVREAEPVHGRRQ